MFKNNNKPIIKIDKQFIVKAVIELAKVSRLQFESHILSYKNLKILKILNF